MRVATVVAALVPALALAGALLVARAGRTVVALACVAAMWGIACTWLVASPEEWWLERASTFSLIVFAAPLMEEFAKAAVLPLLAWTRRTRWFVDGSMLGLAAGTGFAIRENLVYLQRSSDDALTLAFARVTSTNLMHAGCTALVGAALSSPYLTARRRAWWTVPFTLSVASALHMSFNRLTFELSAAVTTTAIGVAVFASAVGLVALGAVLSTRWAQRELSQRGIAEGERNFVGSRRTVDSVLDEMRVRFGDGAATAGAAYVAVQRRLGIATQPGRTPGAAELAALEAEANEQRRLIGVFPMLWLRSRLPVDPDALGIWSSVGDSAPAPSDSTSRPSGLWDALGRAPGGSLGDQ